MSRSSTSSSDQPADERFHEAPAPAIGDAPADDHGGHQVHPVAHRRTGSILAWSIAFLVLFVLIAELGVRALGTLPANRTWPDDESQFKAEHAAHVAADGSREPLVFAGSSVSDAAFDPEAAAKAARWDVATFNYAQEGSLASSTARFLDAAVIDQVRPDVVVLGVFPGDIGAAPTHAAALGDELSASRGYRLANRTPTIGDRLDDAASRRSALVAHREILRDPYRLAQWLRSPSTPPFTDAESGALLRHRDQTYAPPAAQAGGADDGDELAPIGPEVAAISQLADDLAAKGIRLVIVELPVLQSAPDAPSAAARTTTHRAMVDVDGSGCAERLDLRDALQDESYWADSSHVNAAGTESLSRSVGRWLAAHPDAPRGC